MPIIKLPPFLRENLLHIGTDGSVGDLRGEYWGVASAFRFGGHPTTVFSRPSRQTHNFGSPCSFALPLAYFPWTGRKNYTSVSSLSKTQSLCANV